MENPATWNEATKLLNKIGHKKNAREIIQELGAAGLLRTVLDDALDKAETGIDEIRAQHQKMMDEHFCGLSLGRMIYDRLKELGAVE